MYPLATIKKSNCASLPPCNKTLGNHVKRAQVVSKNLEESQSDGSNWRGKTHRIRMEREQYNNRLEPDRFQGRYVPETLGATRRDDATTRMDGAASHIGDVSNHADDERTERMTLMTTLTTWKWWRQHPRTTNSRVPGERTAMTVPTKIRRATFEDVKTYKHTSIKHTKSQKA